MEKIQNHLMQDDDPDKTPYDEGTLAVSESIPPQAGPSGEHSGTHCTLWEFFSSGSGESVMVNYRDPICRNP